jgi:hypothetical protein
MTIPDERSVVRKALKNRINTWVFIFSPPELIEAFILSVLIESKNHAKKI